VASRGEGLRRRLADSAISARDYDSHPAMMQCFGPPRQRIWIVRRVSAGDKLQLLITPFEPDADANRTPMQLS
jgi:hypothetical protein